MSDPIVNELSEAELQTAALNVTVENLTNAVQAYMDSVAKTRNYDSLLSACSYATSSNMPFSIEGKACIDWRDQVWLYCYQVMDDVKHGLRQIPTESELIAELPIMTWGVV